MGMEIGYGIEELCFHPDPRVLIQSECAKKNQLGSGSKSEDNLQGKGKRYMTLEALWSSGM